MQPASTYPGKEGCLASLTQYLSSVCHISSSLDLSMPRNRYEGFLR